MSDAISNYDPDRFLKFLVEQGQLTDTSCQRVTLAARETAVNVERAILELGLLEEDTVYQALATYLAVPLITLEEVDLVAARSGKLPREFMQRALAVPVAQDGNGYLVATAMPDMADTLASISYMLGVPTKGAIASPTTINAAIEAADPTTEMSHAEPATTDVERLQALANDGPVITLVNDLIGKAVRLGASDVHIEGNERSARVRFRIDGVLVTDRTIPDELRNSVASRLKIMANLNISERRRPQDGRAELVVRGRSIDIRMSTLPTQFGESIVLRLLDRTQMPLEWHSLGFQPKRIAEIEALVAQPNGIVLVAGPTGSGKTTTLYTALRGINTEDRKIITVEDPIEYTLDGINQVQVDPAINLSFAAALRAILRQDPNVVMVGEIRDEETAEIAVRAALIGRLVLSTIHTNDALSAVDRLLDLGVAPYLVGATLRGVLSQRLVRTICADCAGQGCGRCNDSGRLGRTTISELLTLSPDMVAGLVKGGSARGLEPLAHAAGFQPIAEEAEHLLARGTVTRDDIHRALGGAQAD